MKSDPISNDIIEEHSPGNEIQSDAQIEQFLATKGGISYHPVGTCKMGHDSMSVVDDQLRVRGVQKLRVIDASIMPTITSGNTNAPTVMIAERGSAFIKTEYNHKN